jgi:hypothetical protein
MPNASNLRKLAKALKTGKTDITDALDELFGQGDPRDHLTSPDPDVVTAATELKNNPGSLNKLSTAMRNVLEGLEGKDVSTEELDHIDDWDPSQKEEVRERLADALTTGHLYHFFWELHRGNTELTEVPPLPGTGGDIHFRSPRKNVQDPSWFHFGDVKVTVGP